MTKHGCVISLRRCGILVVHGNLMNAVVYKYLVTLLIRLLLQTECMEECHIVQMFAV